MARRFHVPRENSFDANADFVVSKPFRIAGLDQRTGDAFDKSLTSTRTLKLLYVGRKLDQRARETAPTWTAPIPLPIVPGDGKPDPMTEAMPPSEDPVETVVDEVEDLWNAERAGDREVAQGEPEPEPERPSRPQRRRPPAQLSRPPAVTS